MGLGLGWSARRILERKKVKHLTIIEKNQHVLSCFGRSLQQDFGDRVTLTQDDAYDVDWQPFDVAIWDIWAAYGQAQDDRHFQQIKTAMQQAGKVCEGWVQNIYND